MIVPSERRLHHDRTLARRIEELDLGEPQKDRLRSLWLEQLRWYERRAIQNQRRHYARSGS